VNTDQVLAIKRFAEGAYPQMKNDGGSDAVWIEMLSTYDFGGMMQTLKNHINGGNKYPPSIAELIGGYKNAVSEYDSKFVEWLEKTGKLADAEGTDAEIAALSLRHRKEKAVAIMSHPLRDSIMPGWFAAWYAEYRAKVERRIYGTSALQIEGGARP